MKRWHHLEWHRFRKLRSPDRRRRRDCLEDVGIRVTRPVRPASATLVDPLDGRLMGYPSLVKMTARDAALTEVVVIFATDPGHHRFETGQLVLEILDGVVQDVEFRGLLSNHLA